MNTFNVTREQTITGKIVTRTVQADNAPMAGVKAISNYLMANGWHVTRITDAQGNEVSQFFQMSENNIMLPSTKKLVDKTIRQYGRYAAIRYMRNLGIDFYDAHVMVLGYAPRFN